MDESEGDDGSWGAGVRAVGVVLADPSRVAVPARLRLLGVPRRRDRAGMGGAGTSPVEGLMGCGDTRSTVDIVDRVRGSVCNVSRGV